ncbi:hypothetical protein KM043_010087 [Ampulex compressa]|nr:hypothetical protein KM043_010087 [Ampulex compressa]
MSLFVINRYEGEEPQSKDEDNHLSELLRKIEKRKSERLEKAKDNAETKETAAGEPKKKKHKKGDHITIDNKIDNDENQQNEDNVEEPQVTYKKKRRKRKADENNDNLDVNDQQCVPSDDKELTGNLENETDGITDSKTTDESYIEAKSKFTILGAKSQKRKREVKRKLPDWLANPEIISIDLSTGPGLADLSSTLDLNLIETLAANGIDKLFPVQVSMITWLLKCDNDRKLGWWPRDTCVSAPTGSGKTLAYVLPIVQMLQSRLVPRIRCLVVLPVQELAAQVHKVMVTYTAHTSLKVGLLSGAAPFEQEQNSILKKTDNEKYISLVDIVIATPGRLVDHILKTQGFSLDALKFLVIDEADRATEWLQYLPEPHSRAPQLTVENMHTSKPPAQKLLFSATLSQDPEKLNRLGLFQPILFTSVVIANKDDDVNLDNEVSDFLGRYTSPEELIEQVVECEAEYKPVALYQLLTEKDTILKTLVFTNSGDTTHRLALLLQSFLKNKRITVGELSSQLTPKQRGGVLSQFAAGEIQVLISSDALARGLDVPDIQLVVSYDLPKHVKGYIHRAGRTGRAGKQGTAVSVVTPKQAGILKQMLSTAHKPVPPIRQLELDSLAERLDYQSHIEKLRDILEKEKTKTLKPKKKLKRGNVKKTPTAKRNRKKK